MTLFEQVQHCSFGLTKTYVNVHNERSASIYSSSIPSKMRFSSVGFVTSREVVDAANQDTARRLFEYASQYE